MGVIVTGTAGFIGHHVAAALLARGETVVGIDTVNDYYDPALKRARLARLEQAGFTFHEASIADRDAVARIFAAHPDTTGIVHLAAQAGVRYSLENPYAYADANVMGQVVMIEAARRLERLAHLVYASSSSVYGANTEMPFRITDRVDRPVSLYAATKRAGELIGYAYSQLYGLALTGLRFFTVYGPWGRPDMAPYLFTDAILRGRPIRVFNGGDMSRDFTFIDDIVAGVIAALDRPAAPDADGVRHRLYNIGNSRPERLMDLIAAIEDAAGRKAVTVMEPMQPGDVRATYADITETARDLGYAPTTPLSVGIPRTVAWHKAYHGLD